MPDGKSDSPVPKTSGLGCLLRLMWMLAGNVVLFLSAVWISQNAAKSFVTAVDGVYAASLFAVVLSRYLDIRYFNGTTGTGEPATMRDWRRFAILVVALGLAAWGVAHGVAFFRAK